MVCSYPLSQPVYVHENAKCPLERVPQVLAEQLDAVHCRSSAAYSEVLTPDPSLAPTSRLRNALSQSFHTASKPLARMMVLIPAGVRSSSMANCWVDSTSLLCPPGAVHEPALIWVIPSGMRLSRRVAFSRVDRYSAASGRSRRMAHTIC